MLRVDERRIVINDAHKRHNVALLKTIISNVAYRNKLECFPLSVTSTLAQYL
jgi:hypothetical protein